jgi:hypothetical protein
MWVSIQSVGLFHEKVPCILHMHQPHFPEDILVTLFIEKITFCDNSNLKIQVIKNISVKFPIEKDMLYGILTG